MTMKRIRLELARCHDFPNGSPDRGYDFAAPLDEDGHLVPSEWHEQRNRCRVHRFWADGPNEVGHLVRKPGGAWAFHYDIHGDVDDDETGLRFDRHQFKPGEYVSIREHDDKVRTFRVMSVTDLD